MQGAGVADRELGVAAARRAEVGHHAAPVPRLVDAVAERVDHPGDLAPRDRRQLRQRHRAHLSPGADHRVDQVDPGHRDRDPDLARPRLGVVQPLVDQVAGGPNSCRRMACMPVSTVRDRPIVVPVTVSAPTVRDLRARLGELTLRDEHRLRRRLDALRGGDARGARPRCVDEFAAAAQARIERRRAAVPAVSYPPELPVSARRDDLLAAIRDHQVVVVAGETGSGKTTQLPKICLELGPRRARRDRPHAAAPAGRAHGGRADRRRARRRRSGGAVGYAVRFSDRSGEDTLVRLMTDGLLLAEIQRDRLLRRYDTIIVDEAHERSLNIDFLLGYLKRILPRRPDLKLIITSATIDPERFAATSATRRSSRCPGARIRSRCATGRSQDERRARPDRRDRRRGRRAAARGARRRARVPQRRARDPRHRRRAATGALRADVEILPLYARLSSAEQQRVFQAAHAAPRRAGHERRRDVADRARHPLRRRSRARRASAATARG